MLFHQILFFSLFFFVIGLAQSNEEYMECHDDPEIIASVNDTLEISAFVDLKIYIWLIIIIIGGMFLHNVVIISYFSRKKIRDEKTNRQHQRFQPFEVIQHALLIISFTTLAISGFALKFPLAFWVEWLVNAGMTEGIRVNTHRAAAVIMIIISLIRTGYFIFHKSSRRDILALLPTIKDVQHFFVNMKYHLCLIKDKPQFPRYDNTEKAEYLALIWGTL